MINNFLVNDRLSLLIKIFIFAILLEPLLFFYLAPGFQLSRILQFLFIFIVFLTLMKVIIDKQNPIFIGEPFFNNPFLVVFFFIIPISFFSGFYSDNLFIELNIFQANDYSNSDFKSFVFFESLNEVLILIYYFTFFYYFTYILLSNRNSLDYFFRLFKFLFLLNLFLGYTDLLISFGGFDLIPRHLYDGINVGNRFHGIAGEPRQAGVFLAFGLSVLYLESVYNSSRMNPFWLVFTIPAIFLTLSFTSIISFLIFLVLLFPIFIIYINKKPLILLVISFITALTTYIVFQIPRVDDYINVFISLLDILERNKDLPYLIRVQLGEVYPLYDQLIAMKEGNLIQLLFGSGIGSSAINNYSYVDTIDALGNPNSQLVRSIYESGLLGTLIFILIFYWPILRLKNTNFETKINFYIATSLVLAFSLGVRSSSIFIYFGLMCSIIFNNFIKTSNE